MADWNKVYNEKTVGDTAAADVLIKNSHLLPDKGEALDYACGLAANGIFLEAKGFKVSAWDLSDTAVEKINHYSSADKLNLKAQKIDLETSLPDIKNQFDVIVVSYFLHRETLRYLHNILKKGGLLFYQTFSGPQIEGRGPSTASFRLRRAELLKIFSDMQLLFYREDNCQPQHKDSHADIVQLVAMK